MVYQAAQKEPNINGFPVKSARKPIMPEQINAPNHIKKTCLKGGAGGTMADKPLSLERYDIFTMWMKKNEVIISPLC